MPLSTQLLRALIAELMVLHLIQVIFIGFHSEKWTAKVWKNKLSWKNYLTINKPSF